MNAWKVTCRIALSAGLTVFALTGCGAGNESANAVKLGTGPGTVIPYLPAYLAYTLNYYEEEGVDVQLVDFHGGSEVTAAVLSGTVDVGSGSYETSLQAGIEGKDIVCFAESLDLSGIALVVAPGTTDVKSIADLAGKRVGVSAPGSSTNVLLDYLLIKAGANPDDVTPVGIGLDASAVASMETGEVAAAMMTDPYLSVLQQRAGKLEILADFRNRESAKTLLGTEEYQYQCLYSTPTWLEQNPELASGMSRAVERAVDFIKTEDPGKVADALPAEILPADQRDLFVESLKGNVDVFADSVAIEPEGAEAARAVLEVSRPEAADLELSKTYTNDYVNQG